MRRFSEAGLPTLRVISSPRIGRYSRVDSDRGIVMLRHLLQKQLAAVSQGQDPAGVSFDPDAPPVHFSSGNFLED